MNYTSHYDTSRDNVGKIYRDAQINGEKQIVIGDMTHELKKGLVEDINIAIIDGTQAYLNAPFYILIYERKDLQMKNAFIRSLFKFPYRPYPEDDTLVFRVVPYTNDVYFCWELPHRSNMLNELNCPDLYDEERLSLYRKWENMQLEAFGFIKDDMGNWKENPMYKGDKILTQHEDRQTTVSFASILV